MECEICAEDIIALCERQMGRCALSGLPFSLRPSESGRSRPFAPSIDRIDCALGYKIENVRIVANIVNSARSDFSDYEFLNMCVCVARHGGGK